LYLDLDNFKDINDEFNHKNGDNVLKVIAERIQCCIRKTDLGARFSGDEFVILLEDINGADNAGLVAKKLQEMISTPILIQNSEVRVTSSLGVAMIPQDGVDIDELIVNADTAMYVAKNEGKNGLSFYTYAMKEHILKRVRLGKNIQKAVDRKEFYIEYQPQYDSRTDKIFGAEALLRWRHPEFGLVSPHEFIPIAEKNGMIIPLGEWVFDEVFSYHNSLESALDQEIRISINLSGRQLFEKQFTQYLANILSESGIDPHLLELEITENCIFSDLEHTVSILKEIKSLGVRLAIDDFGTGYSSLGYLERLPVDTIKIDNSFVHKITSPDVHLPILTGIISIATEMGLDVIAEGVETQMQLAYLKSYGCNLIQGYYFNPAFSERKLFETVKDQDEYSLQSVLALYLTQTS
jgi:diguanylate cyclase (GGDEF)-like protein